YAGAAIARARDELSQAQAAMARNRDDDARALANAAAADADFAYAGSHAAATVAEYRQREAEVAALQQRLQVQGQSPDDGLARELDAAASAADGGAMPTDATALGTRLRALDADARLGGLAAYERFRAQQAVDALAGARGKARDALAPLAARRVATAELAARTESLARQLDVLEHARGDLLVEASRQEADRARQEAERLRLQAQVQAEEAQRLQAAADAEAAARQQAEAVISDVAGSQQAKLDAARDREATLARKEAELTAGAKLPPVRTGADGEVFTLGGGAFAAGKATLSAGAEDNLRALAAYLQQAPGARVRIDAYAASASLARKRAEAVRGALARAGVARARQQLAGHGGSAATGRVELLVTGK
ncbi:MAG TPA: OmpA family protein, partial [Xanthomonadaceae bacterium]|nr:OmpA family protein [Xanthomonadaceae bacterium]